MIVDVTLVSCLFPFKGRRGGVQGRSYRGFRGAAPHPSVFLFCSFVRASGQNKIRKMIFSKFFSEHIKCSGLEGTSASSVLQVMIACSEIVKKYGASSRSTGLLPLH